MKSDYQNILFPYAYNILGSSEDAKDAVQEVVFKYLKTNRQSVENEQAYLVKGVINQSINLKKSKQKLVTPSVWLPEPIATESTESAIVKEEILSYSMLVLLEKLSPKERAVFILREAFDYSHKEIAMAFDCSTDSARTILSRARKKLSGHQRDENISAKPSISQFFDNYIKAIREGDLKSLEQLLNKDISVQADGGSKVNVVSELTIGSKAAGELLLFVYRTFQSRQEIRLKMLNHQPALLFYKGSRLHSCQVFDIENGQVQKVYAIVDPDKLQTIF